jgi:Tfp pilus tip-associated adhesin PilY1
VQFGANSPYEAYSNQRSRLIVLDAATGTPDPANNNASFLRAEEGNSFFNNPFLPVAQVKANPWTNHALYYGLTVSRDNATCLDKGAVYRLQTVSASGGDPLPVASWKLAKLIDTGAPVTGAVNATYDSARNLWVLFGTGRLWNTDDIAPCGSVNTAACQANHRHYIYGVKEPLTARGMMTFTAVQPGQLTDLSGAEVWSGGQVLGLGTNQAYSNIRASLKSSASMGYRRALDLGQLAYPTLPSYEMIITQPKLIPMGNGRSLMAFTSFSPKQSGCGDFGDGYLYLVDTYTGLPDPDTYSLFTSAPVATSPQGARVMGGLTTGKGTPTEAFVIASAAGITVSASAPDASTTSIFIPLGSASLSRLTAWKEVLDSGFQMTPQIMGSDL